MAWDLVIRGGRVVDGTGMPGFTADLAVEGVRAVVVNGELLLDEGKHTGALPGAVLRGR